MLQPPFEQWCGTASVKKHMCCSPRGPGYLRIYWKCNEKNLKIDTNTHPWAQGRVPGPGPGPGPQQGGMFSNIFENLCTFSNYFEITWWRVFKIAIWTHFQNFRIQGSTQDARFDPGSWIRDPGSRIKPIAEYPWGVPNPRRLWIEVLAIRFHSISRVRLDGVKPYKIY